jgi:hypothetical protein
MSKVSQYIILCEDMLQRVFVYRFLRNYDVNPRAIFPVKLPDGDGSGEKYVRTEYPNQIKAYRDRRSKTKSTENTVLIVVIDADNGLVENRQKQLSDAARSVEVAPRSDDDLIVHLIPKRHIETWLAFLGKANNVDEETSYKPQHSFHKKEHESHPLIDEFTEMFRSLRQHQLPLNSPPSLMRALEKELERLRPIL